MACNYLQVVVKAEVWKEKKKADSSQACRQGKVRFVVRNYVVSKINQAVKAYWSHRGKIHHEWMPVQPQLALHGANAYRSISKTFILLWLSFVKELFQQPCECWKLRTTSKGFWQRSSQMLELLSVKKGWLYKWNYMLTENYVDVDLSVPRISFFKLIPAKPI